MAPDAVGEPPIDWRPAYAMEERALAMALEKAGTHDEQAAVRRLMASRADLMLLREAFHREATARRHARGEVYSAARVAAINAMGSSPAEIEREVRTLYGRQPDTGAVLRTHARTHFAHGLVSARLLLASMTPDIAPAGRQMQAREEAFAAEWLAAIADPAFEAQLRHAQREALRVLRTATRPMVLVTQPPQDFADEDARVLGKAWNRLDELAQSLGMPPLSGWIALPGEDDAGAPASQLLPAAEALAAALQEPGTQIAAKRATQAAVARMRDALRTTAQAGGRAWFEIDI